jgi:hypothetical protein
LYDGGFIDFFDAETCKAPIYCNGEKVSHRYFYTSWVRGAYYIRLLNSLYGTGLFSVEYLDLLKQRYDAGADACKKIKYCPANMKILHVQWTPSSVFNELEGTPYLNEDGCTIQPCGLTNVEICTETIVQDNPAFNAIMENSPGILVNDCKSANYSLKQLIIWEEAIKAQFPNFINSRLYLQFVDLYRFNPEAACLFIVFCTKEGDRQFEILNDPYIDDVECNGITDCYGNGPTDNQGNQMYSCVDGSSNSTFNILYDEFGIGVFENLTLPGFQYQIVDQFPGFFFTSGNAEEYKNKSISNRSNNGPKLNIPSSNATVRPNPFTNLVTINFDAMTSSEHNFEITDLHGKSITNKKCYLPVGNHQIQLKLNDDLPTGVYFLKMSDSKLFQYTLKLIKI